jgi:hypothetical protein
MQGREELVLAGALPSAVGKRFWYDIVSTHHDLVQDRHSCKHVPEVRRHRGCIAVLVVSTETPLLRKFSAVVVIARGSREDMTLRIDCA